MKILYKFSSIRRYTGVNHQYKTKKEQIDN